MTRFLLLLSAALLSLSACKKEKAPLDTLPEASQTGANTMGCLVDGQAFSPGTTGFNRTAVHATRFTRRSRMLLSFSQEDGNRNRSIIFSIPYLRRPGRYALDQAADPTFTTSTPAYAYFSFYNPEPTGYYLTNPKTTGQVLITRFDSVAHIVSGTFEFAAQKTSGEGPETVQITDGRFDVHYPQ
jgi:hypothetical protein